MSKRKRSKESRRRRFQRYLFLEQRKTAVEFILNTAYFDVWRGEKICLATLPDIQNVLTMRYGFCMINEVPFPRGLVLSDSQGAGCEQNGELYQWATGMLNAQLSDYSKSGFSENAKTATHAVTVTAENGGEGGETAQCQ